MSEFINCYVDGRFNPPMFCDNYLMTKYRFAATRDTESLYYYDGKTGAWKNGGDQIVKTEIAEQLAGLYKARFVNECVTYLAAKNYVDRSVFNSHRGINLANGVFNVETMKVEEHNADYHYTYSLPVDYDPKSRPLKIAQFLVDICGGDGEKLVTLLESVALCLMPNYEIQKALMLVGNGSNGKSTYLNMLKAFLGPENVSSLTLQQITESSFSTAQLFGKLANIAADLPSEQIYESGIFKAATGGDSIFADQKFKGGITFSNTAKLFFAANRIPPVSEDSAAYFRRWMILEMDARFPTPKPGLLTDLTTHDELSGLLNLMIEFVLPRMNKQMGFTFEKPVDEIREIYSRKSNSAKAFIDSCLMQDTSGTITKEAMWSAYKDWTKRADLITVTETYFWLTMKKNCVYDERRKIVDGVSKRWIVGLALDKQEAGPEYIGRGFLEVLTEVYGGLNEPARVSRVFLIVQPVCKQVIDRENYDNSGKPSKELPQNGQKSSKTEILSNTKTILAQAYLGDHPIIAYLKAHGGQATYSELTEALGSTAWDDLEPLEMSGDVFKPRQGSVRLVHNEES